MKISELISSKRVFFVDTKDKFSLFKKMAEISSEILKLTDSEDILKLLNEREKLGSTYAGSGFAIPHIKCKKIDDFYLFLFILKSEINYDEDRRIRYVFFVVGPDRDYQMHLVILSRIARMIKETNISEIILNETDKEKIVKLIFQTEEKII